MVLELAKLHVAVSHRAQGQHHERCEPGADRTSPEHNDKEMTSNGYHAAVILLYYC